MILELLGQDPTLTRAKMAMDKQGVRQNGLQGIGKG